MCIHLAVAVALWCWQGHVRTTVAPEPYLRPEPVLAGTWLPAQCLSLGRVKEGVCDKLSLDLRPRLSLFERVKSFLLLLVPVGKCGAASHGEQTGTQPGSIPWFGGHSFGLG